MSFVVVVAANPCISVREQPELAVWRAPASIFFWGVGHG